jgi:hypothetical protein
MMHAHDFDPGLAASPHLSVSREVDEADPALLQAAAAGRTDAMSPSALLSLQRLAGNASVSSLMGEEIEESSPVREVVSSGGGVPLESSTRSDMESRLGHDFTDVRIHTGPKANESARAINAQAYTVGTNVVFQTGKFAPDTPTGMHTLAHELTHVVQQRNGPVAGAPAPGGIRLSDPSDAFEQAAERTAVTALTPSSTTASGETSVQRAGEEEEKEEETAQTLVAQRATMVEEQDEEQA